MAHRQAGAAIQQARIAEENHVTGIFSKSVELLGLVREIKTTEADGVPIVRSIPNIESRLGAPYSLERLLRESRKDQRAILETLCAYIRENSPAQLPENEQEAKKLFRGETTLPPTRRSDVQATLTIIGRRSESIRQRAASENWDLDLRTANLSAYDLSNLNFDQADFSNTFLTGAKMDSASFAYSTFKDAAMREADLTQACFKNSIFDHCDVKNAQIKDSDFRNSKIINTDFRQAKVVSFNICGANFDDAFNYSLEYAVKSVRSKGATHFNSDEIVRVDQLFRKATYDQQTTVSQATRDALEMMVRSRENSETHAEQQA